MKNHQVESGGVRWDQVEEDMLRLNLRSHTSTAQQISIWICSWRRTLLGCFWSVECTRGGRAFWFIHMLIRTHVVAISRQDFDEFFICVLPRHLEAAPTTRTRSSLWGDGSLVLSCLALCFPNEPCLGCGSTLWDIWSANVIVWISVLLLWHPQYASSWSR